MRSANDPSLVGHELPTSTARQLIASIPLRAVITLPNAAAAAVFVPPLAEDKRIVGVSALTPDKPMGPVHRHLLVFDAAGADPVPLLGDAADNGATAVVLSGVTAGRRRACRTTAARHGLALMFTDPEPAKELHADILSLLLKEQTALLTRIDQVHRMIEQSVLTGGTLDELAGYLITLMDGAVMVTSTDGRVLASSGTDDDLAHARRQSCFDRTGRLIVEQERFGVIAEEGSDGWRAMVRIVAASADLGRLVAFSSRRELTEQDVHILERAATVAALAITRAQAVSAVESKYRAEFLRDALAGRAGQNTEAVAHARSLGWDIDRPMVVVVAETDENDQQTTRPAEEIRTLQERFTRAWVHGVAVRDPLSPVVGFSQEVVTLFPIPDGASRDVIVRLVGDVSRVVRGDGGGGRRTFCTGISRPVRSAEAFPRAYDEALNAVAVGRQIHGSSAITHFDDLGTYRLLALIPDTAALRRFVQETLKDLATDADPQYAEHRRTLSLLIDTNMNVAESARLLFVHYNTLRYRIGKLEQLLGPFTTDPELRITVALALRIHQMRGI